MFSACRSIRELRTDNDDFIVFLSRHREEEGVSNNDGLLTKRGERFGNDVQEIK